MWKIRTRKTLSLCLKLSVVLCSLGGVAISLFQAVADGYSHWYKRLFYFTAYSNLSLGFTFLILFFFVLFNKKINRTLALFRYVYTVCITITLLVFCFILVPFATPSYHLNRFSSMLTHFFSPIFAIIDFFLFPNDFPIEKKHRLFCVFPPLFYSTFSIALSFLLVDFGRGDNFPYPFMNPLSAAKFFGFSREIPFTGTFYWLLFLAFLVYLFAILLSILHNKNRVEK